MTSAAGSGGGIPQNKITPNPQININQNNNDAPPPPKTTRGKSEQGGTMEMAYKPPIHAYGAETAQILRAMSPTTLEKFAAINRALSGNPEDKLGGSTLDGLKFLARNYAASGGKFEEPTALDEGPSVFGPDDEEDESFLNDLPPSLKHILRDADTYKI